MWSFLLGRAVRSQGWSDLFIYLCKTHSAGEGRGRSQEWSGLLTYLCRNIYTILQKPPAYQPCAILRHPRGAMTCETVHSSIGCGATVLSWEMGALAHFVFWSPRPNKSPLWDKHPAAIGGKGKVTHLANSCWQWSRRWGRNRGHSSQGLICVASGGLQQNWTEGSCVGRGEYSLTKSWNFIFCTCRDINLERAFIIQGPNRSIRRSIKRRPARGSAQGAHSICCSRRTTNWLALLSFL
jgi:hypothetical protein